MEKKKLMVGYAIRLKEEPYNFCFSRKLGVSHFLNSKGFPGFHDRDKDDWREVIHDEELSKGYPLKTLDDLAKWIEKVNWFYRVFEDGWKVLKEHEKIENMPLGAIVIDPAYKYPGEVLALIWEEDI